MEEQCVACGHFDVNQLKSLGGGSAVAAGEGGAVPIEAVAPVADPAISTFVGEELSKSERHLASNEAHRGRCSWLGTSPKACWCNW